MASWYNPSFGYKDRGSKPGDALNYYAKKYGVAEKVKKYCPNHPVRVIKPQFSVCYSCYQSKK